MDHVSKYQIVIRRACGCTLYSKQERQRWRRSSKRLICGTDRSETQRSNSSASAFFNTHRKQTSSVLLHSAESTLHWRPAWWRNKQKHTYTHTDKHNKTDQLDITSSSLFGTDIYRGRPYTPICIINTYTHMILISSATHKPLIFTNDLLYTFRAVHNNFPSSGGEQHCSQQNGQEWIWRAPLVVMLRHCRCDLIQMNVRENYISVVCLFYLFHRATALWKICGTFMCINNTYFWKIRKILFLNLGLFK